MAANDLVRETEIAGKGKGYVAARAISRGEIVGEEKPFAYAVEDDSAEDTCHECCDGYATAIERNRFGNVVFEIDTINFLLQMPLCALLRCELPGISENFY